MAENDRSTVLPWSVPNPELGSARSIYSKCYGRSMCDLQALSEGKSFPVLSLDTIDNYLDTIFVSRYKQLNAGY